MDHTTHPYLPAEQLAKRIERAGVEGDQPIITYYHAGNAAGSTAFALALMGKSDVSIYDGSLREWAADPALPMRTSVE